MEFSGEKMETLHTKTIIIGGGPSGANAARSLAESGEDVILIEKDFSFEKPCGGGLFLRAFDEFDIPKSLIKKRVNTINIISPNVEKVSVDISDHPLGVVHRQAFDSALRDLAQAAGAQVIEAKMNTITPTPDGVEVHAHRSDGSALRIEAEYAIAADGVNSSVRRRLLDEVPSRVLTYYADLHDEETASCQFWFGDDISPGYYAWIFPHHEGVNVGLVADDKHRMRQFYDRFFDKASINESPPKPKGYFIPHWKPMTLYRDHVFYVGDSASLVLPFTYEGIYYALKSGKLAAEAIIKNDPDLYEKSWNNLYLKKFKFLRILQSIFLRNDWWATQMSRLYRHQKFQRAVIGYWSGTKEPYGLFLTLYKAIKALIVYR